MPLSPPYLFFPALDLPDFLVVWGLGYARLRRVGGIYTFFRGYGEELYLYIYWGWGGGEVEGIWESLFIERQNVKIHSLC